MILATHAVIGAGAALASKNPVLGFVFAIGSHFLSDMIPHWHYPLRSLEKKRTDPLDNTLHFNRTFLIDLGIIGAECLLGFAIAIGGSLAYHKDWKLAAIGAVGGVLPDFFQFLYYIAKRTPLRQIQIFHKWIHTEILLDDRHVVGVGSQIFIVALIIFLIARL